MSSSSSQVLPARKRRLSHTDAYENAKHARKDDDIPAVTRKSWARDDYTVGWICALDVELTAATAMLDHRHAELNDHSENDCNQYTYGSIGPYNIVIASLPHREYGTNNAAKVAINLSRSFRSVKLFLLVGIGGGVPRVWPNVQSQSGIGNPSNMRDESYDIRLGDIVVSTEVVQYDLGRFSPGGFIPTARPRGLQTVVGTALTKFKSLWDSETHGNQVSELLQHTIPRRSRIEAYAFPKDQIDRLFESDYEHKERATSLRIGEDSAPGHGENHSEEERRQDCSFCDRTKVVTRPVRAVPNVPRVFYGTIASGNAVIRDAKTRDQIAHKLDCCCFEMEAAGMDFDKPWLIIRGICDYSDSHKNKKWQKYAAATSATVAKQFLSANVFSVPRSNSIIPAQEDAIIRDRRTRLWQSLAFNKIDDRRDTIKNALKGTCEWLISHEKYLSWLAVENYDQHSGFLWMYGKPGAGKSTMMKLASRRFPAVPGRDACISFFFTARGDSLEKSTLGMYRSLLYDILKLFPDLRSTLDEVYVSPTTDPLFYEWRLGRLQTCFEAVIQKFGSRRLVCFVDALDECEEEQIREMIENFERLGRVAFENGVKFYICFSSRPYPTVAIERCLKFNLDEQQEHQEDLTRYIRKTLNKGTSARCKPICDQILVKSNGVFLWVVLVIQILNKAITSGHFPDVKKRLNEIPQGLTSLFKDILRRDTDHMERFLLCLQWILYAKRPLSCQELYFAIISGTELDSLDSIEYHPEFTTTEDTEQFLISSSKGLAELTKSKSPTVQFIHESVRDFLVKENGLQDMWHDLRDSYTTGHDRLKTCCFNYYTQVDPSTCYPKAFPSEFFQHLPQAKSEEGRSLKSKIMAKFPFLSYAIENLFYHTNETARQRPQDKFIAEIDMQKWAGLHNVLQVHSSRRYETPPSPVYVWAEKDHAQLIKTSSCVLPGLNEYGQRHEYPLFAAIASGNDAALEELFARDVDASIRTSKGKSALDLTIHHDNPNAFRRLLGKGLYENLAGSNRKALLLDTIKSKRLVMIQELVSRKAVDAGEVLREVVSEVSIETVQLLLDGGADVNAQGGRYGNALQAASRRGSIDIVQLLLDKGADVNTPGGLYGNALQASSCQGSIETVQLLLDKGADVNAQGGHYGNALQAASCQGSIDIVQLLLDKDADVNAQGGYHGNALQAASCQGSIETVQLLLDKGADVNAQGGHYGNALQAASCQGSIDIVQLLLDKDADVNAQGGYHGNALQAASCQGSIETVQLLLDKDADVNAQGGDYGNALQAASRRGSIDIVQLLLDRGANVNAQGGVCGNALQAASRRGSIDIVQLLLDRGANVNAQGGHYGNALIAASKSGSKEIVQLLRNGSATR